MTNEERIAQVRSIAKNDKEAIEMLLSATADMGSENGCLLSVKKFSKASELICSYFKDSRRCMYCGGSVPDTNEAMLEHIFSCEKRPEKTLLAKAFEVEDGLYAKIKHLMHDEYNPVMCKVCQEIEKDMARYDSVPAEETDGS